MKRSELVERYDEKKLKVTVVTFLEDGYEVILRKTCEEDFKKVEEVKHEGLSIVSVEEYDTIFRVVLVPITLDEINDYIWRYIEKYGNKSNRYSILLSDAVCALEKAIEYITCKEDLNEAIYNFNTFTSQIF